MTNQQGTPEAMLPIARYKIGYHTDEWGMRSSTPGGITDPSGQWVLYKDHVAALVDAQQPAPSAADECGRCVGTGRIDTGVGALGHEVYVDCPDCQPSPAPQADSQPARDEERKAFKAAHRHLELDEVPDAWGRPTFKHSHVEASWLGWIARAARAPADSVTAPAGGVVAGPEWKWVSPGQLEVFKDTDDAPFGTYIPARKTIAGKFTMPLFAAAPTPPAQAADSVLEDAARLDWLDQQCEAYGFQDIHEGNRWEISGPYANVRVAIDAERAARKQGASHD